MSVKIEKYVVVKNGVDQNFIRACEIVSKYFIDIKDLTKSLDRTNTFISDGQHVALKHLGFKFTPNSSGDIEIEIKKVETEGPILNLLGFYLDLSTGLVLLGINKRTEYYALFDFYGYLREYGVVMDSDKMKYVMERFKSGLIDINQMATEMIELSRSSEDLPSMTAIMISELFSENGEQPGNKAPFTGGSLIAVFKTIVRSLSLLEVTDNWGNRTPLEDLKIHHISSIEEKFPGLGQFFTHLKEHVYRIDPVRSYYNNLQLTPKTKGNINNLPVYDEVPSKINDAALSLSTGAYTSYLARTVHDSLPRATAIALNFYDMMEEVGRDAVVYHGISTLDRSQKQDVDIIDRIIDQIGVKELLKGRSLSSLKMGLRREDTAKYIDMLNKAQYVYRSKETEYMDNMVKMSKLVSAMYRRAIKTVK